MVKGRRNPDDKLKNIEDEVDRLIRKREKVKETMPEVLYVHEGKKRKEEYIKPEFVPKPKTKKRRIFRKTGFLKSGIVKPVAIILVISMILTGVQLVSLISTGETVIVPSDFGIPKEFENAKQEFEAESVEVKQKAEDLLNNVNVNWSVEELPEKNRSYDPDKVIKSKPRWESITPIFEDIEEANIVLESTYVSWTHTTTTDFNNNCSDSVNVNIADDMIKLQTLGVGMFISEPLDSGIDNAVLKDVSWNPTEQPGESQIVIIIEISDTKDGPWKPIWSSAEIEALPDWFKELFPDLREFVPEFTPAKYFRYRVGFYSLQLLKRPYLEDITISATITALDRKYYVFTYYQSDTPLLDEDGVAGLKIPEMITIPEYNLIDTDGDSHGDIAVSLMLNVTINEPPPPELDWATPPTHLIGGLDIEIYKIKELEGLTIYFVKPISYENKTYIWIIGFNFSFLPEHFSFNMISENIVVEATAYAMGGETLVDVQPPYEITWSMSSQIDDFTLSVGYAKFEPVNATYYLEASFSPGVDGYIDYEEEETAEEFSLTWKGSDETRVEGCYREENLYAEFKIDNLPSEVFLSIGNGFLAYNASAPLVLSFEAYDFDDASVSYANLSLPSNITITGGFGIAEFEDVEPDPSDTFIGRVLNSIITKIKSRMGRIKKTLNSIPEAVYTKEGLRFKSEKPANITLGHLKGRVENNVIHCERLNLSGNYIGMLNSSIQACLKNVTELNLSLGKNITIMLNSSSEEGLKGIAVYGSTEVLINIPKLPDSLTIKGTAEKIDYSSLSEKGEPEKIELNILAKTQNYNIDATIKNITSGSLGKKDQNITLEFDQPVELECAVGKGSLYKMTGNYFFANTSEKTVSLRLENLKSLYAGERLGLTLSEEYPLKMLLETNFTSGKILVKNLPRFFNVSLSSSLITLPEMENVSLTGVSDLFSSVANSLGEAMQNLDKIVRDGFVSEKLCFSYESASYPALIANLSSGENNLPWQHGITLKKSNLTLDMKIYLELPKKATFSFDRGNGLELRYQFENWDTSFNWVSATLEIGNKNLFALLNISGLENAEGVIKVVEEEQVQPPDGVTPPTTGELNLSIELFLNSIPQKLNLTIIRGSNLSLSWNASNSIKGIYLNILREDKNGSYPSHLIVRNTPVKADFTITHSSKKTTLFQVPEINVSASNKTDFNLKLDAGLVGGRGDFLLYAEGMECFSLKAHDNTVTINSMVDKLLFRLSNTSLGGMKEIEILSLDLKSLTFTANFIFGKFPILEVNCNAKETQINLIPSISTPFGEKNSVALTDFSFLSLNIRKNSVRITDTRTHYITVAPILSLWW